MKELNTVKCMILLPTCACVILDIAMKHFFLYYHPAAVFTYIGCAIVSAMLTYSPVYVIPSLACACACSIYFNGAGRFVRALRALWPFVLILLVITPLSNRRGATVLAGGGRISISLEAVIFALCMAGMLLAVFIWFQCYQKLITNDKILFLFGRIAPTSAMVISMIVKFIPVTAQKLRGIREARKALDGTGRGGSAGVGRTGRGGSAGGSDLDSCSDRPDGKRPLIERIRDGIRTVSILMSRCLEDSIETADSMKARGYGTRRRTVFAAQRFALRDGISIAVCGALFIAHAVFVFTTAGGRSFFPFFIPGRTDPVDICLYAVMLLWPLLIEVKDGLVYLARTA